MSEKLKAKDRPMWQYILLGAIALIGLDTLFDKSK
jgi:hypothetical protein